ncbi:hypothetical protein SCOR_17745 [Sulfidibacter corallicola]
MSKPCGNKAFRSRKASRTLRLIKFRFVALPTFLETVSPILDSGKSLGSTLKIRV